MEVYYGMGYIGEKARGDPSKEKELRAFVGDPDEFEQEPRVAPWFRFNLRGLVFIIAEENRRGRVDGPTININLYIFRNKTCVSIQFITLSKPSTSRILVK